jgi:hypothetical protein
MRSVDLAPTISALFGIQMDHAEGRPVLAHSP